MNRSMPGLPVHHQLPEITQTHVHWVNKYWIYSIVYFILALNSPFFLSNIKTELMSDLSLSLSLTDISS